MGNKIFLIIGSIFFLIELIVGLFIGLSYLNLDKKIVDITAIIMLIFGVNVLGVVLIYVGLKNE
jgi:hypothetical protein